MKIRFCQATLKKVLTGTGYDRYTPGAEPMRWMVCRIRITERAERINTCLYPETPCKMSPAARNVTNIHLVMYSITMFGNLESE
jgi:hypothetical protein